MMDACSGTMSIPTDVSGPTQLDQVPAQGNDKLHIRKMRSSGSGLMRLALSARLLSMPKLPYLWSFDFTTT